MAPTTKTGRLVLCPTPLGNLGDITLRTLQTLRECDAICAEDTRVTGRLLAAHGIEKRLERVDEATLGSKTDSLLRRVSDGETIAYCSDAGMPGVSDPGLRLVRAFREAGVPVEVLPGASAAATAYVASGCTNPRYYFGGFFPRKANERSALLASLSALDAALVFYESPLRVAAALAAMAQAFPLRDLAVCRELTKMHEEIVRGPSGDVAAEFARRAEADGVKGEIVIVIDGPNASERDAREQDAESEAVERARELGEGGMRNKEIARILTEEFALPRNAAYRIALSVSGG